MRFLYALIGVVVVVVAVWAWVLCGVVVVQERDKARREHNEKVRALVNYVRRRDPRMIAIVRAAKAERGMLGSMGVGGMGGG